MSGKTVAIIQARLGSTRLPGKVLMKVLGKPLLQHMLERVTGSRLVDEFIVATSIKESDAKIAELCGRLKVKCFRGSEADVLDRYYQCAKSLVPVPDYVVRLTADCPLHDPGVIDFAIKEYRSSECDYFSNSFGAVYEDGFDVEVFSFGVLESAWKKAAAPFEREHVTVYIRNGDDFVKKYKTYRDKYDVKFGLSVDTPRGFELIKRIFEKFQYMDRQFTINDVMELLSTDSSFAGILKEAE